MGNRVGVEFGRIALGWVRTALGFAMCAMPSSFGAAHQHLNAGALAVEAGSKLYFVNGDRFAATSGYVVGLERATGGVHAGLYRGSISLTALPSTSDYGGPAFGHALPGSHLEVVVESVSGPAGGRFGFWESRDGEEGTEVTFRIATGTVGGTDRFVLSETDGSAGVDPYGHIHGRVFTADTPGLYVVGLRLEDTSGHGPGGKPLHAASERFLLQFQAGVTLLDPRVVSEGVEVRFGALSGFRYQLEMSGTVGSGAVWDAVGPPVVGQDRVAGVSVSAGTKAAFFRLRRDAI